MKRQNRDYRDDLYLSSRKSNHPKRKRYNPDEIDRYNYVDRDIYSSNRPHKNNKRKKHRKKSGLKKFITSIICLILLTFLGVYGYGKYMLSRLDRSEK